MEIYCCCWSNRHLNLNKEKKDLRLNLGIDEAHSLQCKPFELLQSVCLVNEKK